MDWLMMMLVNGKTGELSGTISHFANIASTTPENAITALEELKQKGAAEVLIFCPETQSDEILRDDEKCHTVTFRNAPNNAIVTLGCRRMKREYKSLLYNASRQKRHREKSDSNAKITQRVTPEKPEKPENGREVREVREENTHTGEASQTSTFSSPVQSGVNGHGRGKDHAGFMPTKGGGQCEITRTQVSQWESTYPHLDIVDQIKRAKQWLIDNPSRGKTARGMAKYLGGWLARATPPVDADGVLDMSYEMSEEDARALADRFITKPKPEGSEHGNNGNGHAQA